MAIGFLRTACLEAKRWHNQGFSHLKVGVNLSVVQFNHADLIPTISKVLEETELKPEALDIEITESIAINQKSICSCKTRTTSKSRYSNFNRRLWNWL